MAVSPCFCVEGDGDRGVVSVMVVDEEYNSEDGSPGVEVTVISSTFEDTDAHVASTVC